MSNTETPSEKRASVPFARYSGYNKGVRRPFDSLEPNYLDDSVQTIPVPQAGKLDIITPLIIGSQVFSVNDVASVAGTGWGNMPYGDTPL